MMIERDVCYAGEHRKHRLRTNDILSCPECQKQFALQARHIERDMSNDLYYITCPKCGKRFAEVYFLNRVVKAYEG